MMSGVMRSEGGNRAPSASSLLSARVSFHCIFCTCSAQTIEKRGVFYFIPFWEKRLPDWGAVNEYFTGQKHGWDNTSSVLASPSLSCPPPSIS